MSSTSAIRRCSADRSTTARADSTSGSSGTAPVWRPPEYADSSGVSASPLSSCRATTAQWTHDHEPRGLPELRTRPPPDLRATRTDAPLRSPTSLAPVASSAASSAAASGHAPRPPAPATGLSAASVPRILLGLGATCLLVAAVIFLAVAWTWLGDRWPDRGPGRAHRRHRARRPVAGPPRPLGRRRGADHGGARSARAGPGRRPSRRLARGADRRVVPDPGRSAPWLLSLALCLPARRLVTPQLAAPSGSAPSSSASPRPPSTRSCWRPSACSASRRSRCWAGCSGSQCCRGARGSTPHSAYVALVGLAAMDAADHPTVRGAVGRGPRGRPARRRRPGAAALGAVPRRHPSDAGELRQVVCAVSVSDPDGGRGAPGAGRRPHQRHDGRRRRRRSSGRWSRPRLRRGGTPCRGCRSRAPRWCSCRSPLILAAQGIANLLTVAEPFTADASVRLDPAAPYAHPLLLPLGVAGRRARRRADAASDPVRGLGVRRSAGRRPGCSPRPSTRCRCGLFVAGAGPLGARAARPPAPCSPCWCWPRSCASRPRCSRAGSRRRAARRAVLPFALAAFALDRWPCARRAVGRPLARHAVLGRWGCSRSPCPGSSSEASGRGRGRRSSAMTGVATASRPSVSRPIHLTLAGALVTATRWCTATTGRWPGWADCCSPRPPGYGSTTSASRRPRPTPCPPPWRCVLVGVHRLLRDPTPTRRPRCCPGSGWPPCRRCSGRWSTRSRPAPRSSASAASCCCWPAPALRWSAPVARRLGWSAPLLVLRELAPYAAETPQWVLIGTAGTAADRRRHHLGGAAARPAPGGRLPRAAALTRALTDSRVLPRFEVVARRRPGPAGGSRRAARRVAPYAAITARALAS